MTREELLNLLLSQTSHTALLLEYNREVERRKQVADPGGAPATFTDRRRAGWRLNQTDRRQS